MLCRKADNWPPALPDLDSERTLVLAFGGSDLLDDPKPLAQLAAAYPRSQVVGCSSAGEIVGEGFGTGGLAVAVARFRRASLRTAYAEVAGPAGSRAAGEVLGRALAGPGLKGVVVLSDGLGVNGSELARGLAGALPTGVVVTGGLAGDDDRFARTWVLRGERPVGGVVSALGLYGEGVRVSHGSGGGWDIFGPERLVTRSTGNVLYELDGKPALALYKEYLGERAAGLPATALLFPLALRSSDPMRDGLVRTVLAVDENSQSMTFAGDVPEGECAQLMHANLDRLVDAASRAATMTGATAPVLSLAVSCVGRRLVLGERVEEELEATLEALPAGSRQVGFYSYGELSPHAAGPCTLHNQTMTLTTISEV